MMASDKHSLVYAALSKILLFLFQCFVAQKQIDCFDVFFCLFKTGERGYIMAKKGKKIENQKLKRKRKLA